MNQELKYINKNRWMECPNEFNLDHVNPPLPQTLCETQVEIRAVGKGERRHRMLHVARKKSVQNPKEDRGA